jgi:RNA:NAD 2'-phosphotransferase (TPT1/KptA family)
VVDAGRAANDGVAFYRGNDDTWLSETIPPEYLRVSEDS